MIHCYFCQKTHIAGYNVSHSKTRTKRLMRANLQTRKIDGKKIKVCTRCIKSSKLSKIKPLI
ncbi:MAG: bL28 family ribosomal protein [Patescibacteria group bacterium]